MVLDQINQNTIERLICFSQAEKVQPATTNRRMQILRAVLNKCAGDWQWSDRAAKVRILKEPKGHVCFLSPEQTNVLLVELPPHPHQRAMVAPEEAKAGKAIRVPLDTEALAF